MRGAVDRAVAPEISRRLAEIAGDADEAFSLSPNRAILWRGHAVAEIVGGTPFAPKVRLDGELGAAAARSARPGGSKPSSPRRRVRRSRAWRG